MASLQYVIDSMCASVTVGCVYKIIEASLNEGSFHIDEILPLIQTKDHSLDLASAKLIVKAALDEMVKTGVIRSDGDNIYPAKGVTNG